MSSPVLPSQIISFLYYNKLLASILVLGPQREQTLPKWYPKLLQWYPARSVVLSRVCGIENAGDGGALANTNLTGWRTRVSRP